MWFRVFFLHMEQKKKRLLGRVETLNTRGDSIIHRVRGESMALALMDDDDNNNVSTARRLYDHRPGKKQSNAASPK